MNTPPPAVPHMERHVLQHLSEHRKQFPPGTPVPPLFVAVQGPQGSGKTFLTSCLQKSLSALSDCNKVAVLSIDDLYLPHEGLVSVAQANSDNHLLKGRGQPGTHDVEIGTRLLTQLKRINENSTEEITVDIPIFDKSLFNGEGDRLPQGTIIRGPIDIVLFEGWCVGFHPITKDEINRRWELPVRGLGPDFFKRKGFRKEDVLDINERLRSYVPWWSFFDLFIQIRPDEDHPYVHIYKWRLQQEHNMKAKNGGRGMTDEQVETFIDRYIPGYVFFGDGVAQGELGADGSRRPPPWFGKGLCIQIDENRDVVDVTKF